VTEANVVGRVGGKAAGKKLRYFLEKGGVAVRGKKKVYEGHVYTGDRIGQTECWGSELTESHITKPGTKGAQR